MDERRAVIAEYERHRHGGLQHDLASLAAARTIGVPGPTARAWTESARGWVERDLASPTNVVLGAADTTLSAESCVDDLQTGNAPEDGKWEFDGDVAKAFDDMLFRSIPSYPQMREIVTAAASWFMAQDADLPLVIDLGASRGEQIAWLRQHAVAASYLAVESADAMIEELRRVYHQPFHVSGVQIVQHDLRGGLPPSGPATVVLSVLTLQFIPIEHRQRLMREVYDRLRPGGALIMVEKVLGESAESQAMLTDLYHAFKKARGYSDEAVRRKALALEGALVPLTAQINEEWLRSAGFAVVESVWSHFNFRAWVAVKRGP